MSLKTRALLVIALLFCLANTLPAEKAPHLRRSKITLSKETTRVNGPLNKDGYIDYMQVINQRMSVGVTAENNANVLLWKAIGPHSEGSDVEPDFFKLMKTEMPPETGDYFTNLEVFAAEQLKLERNSLSWYRLVDYPSTARSHAWTALDYPHIAAWLKYNEKPLALVTEASRRPRYYSPLFPVPSEDGKPPGDLISAWLPGAQATRDFARALSARAMLHLGNGHPEAAWEDIMACHRLSRLMTEGATVVEVLVGFAISDIAGDATLAYIEYVKPNARQAALIARQLDQLRPLPVMADRIDLCERFTYLDAIQRVAVTAGSNLDLVGNSDAINNVVFNVLQYGTKGPNMWDVVLKKGNASYDRLVKAMRIKDPVARLAAVQAFEQDRAKRSAYMNSTLKTFAKIAKSGPLAQGVGEVLGDMMESLLMDCLSSTVKSELRNLQRQDHLQIALALAAYHADQGEYPEKLLALKPKYLKEVPLDRFSGKALLYRRTQEGYLFYSVFLNGKDDQGQTWDDQPGGDDQRVRMPHKSPVQQD